MRRMLLSLLFCFSCCVSSGLAQTEHYRFEQLSEKLDWQGNAVNAVLQDHRGFLWMATWSGLFRYDGYSVKVYRQNPNNENGLQSNKVISLFEDSQNRLWVGTYYTGFYLYDEEQDGFINYAHEADNMNSLSNDNVWAIQEDQQGFLWIGTENGLNRFDPESGQFLHFFHSEKDERSLSHNFVYSLAHVGEMDLFVGTETGLNRMVYNDGDPYFIRFDLAPGGLNHDDYLRHNFIYELTPSKVYTNTLWVGTSIGLMKITHSEQDLTQLEVKTYYHDSGNQQKLSHHFISSIHEEPETKQLWIGTYKGLNLLDLTTGKFQRFVVDVQQADGLSNNVVRALWKDRNGLLWIGTNQGVEYVNLISNPFRRIPFSNGETSNNQILATLVKATDRSGIWAATDGGGLHHVVLDGDQPQRFSYQLIPPSVPELAGFISMILLDHQHNLWVSTKGAGLLRIKESDIPLGGGGIDKIEQFTKGDLLQDDYIMSIKESIDKDIWLGYWDNGLGRYDHKEGRFYHYPSTKDLQLDLRAFPVVQMLETGTAGNSTLWLGARGNGLYKLQFDRDQNELMLLAHYKFRKGQAAGISNNFVSNLYTKGDGYLWIGTENGVNRLDIAKEEFTYFVEKDGLGNGAIQAVLSGNNPQEYWISTQEGIARLEFLDGGFTVKNFDRFDGLGDNHFYASSALKMSNGTLVFGGVKGLSAFLPEDLSIDTIPPKIVLTDFKLFNASVPIGESERQRGILATDISKTSHLQLNYTENVLAFEFVGLQFAEPEKIQYAYQLEGFNDQWFYTDADNRVANYTNLPYDDFIFRVKAANSDGYWSEPVEIYLRVLPPFWLTNWAFGIYGLLSLVLFYGVWKVTRLKAEFRHSLQLEKLEREKLAAVNQMKLRFFTNISHELRTPLTLIITPLEQFIKEQVSNKKLHQSFSMMHQNANRLLRMINQLLDIRKTEAGLLKLQVAEGNIVKFIYEIVVSFKGMAQHRGIQLSFRAHQPEIRAWYDRDEMEKVLYNLLSNALKFTAVNGRIQVEVWIDRLEQEVVVAVEDSGVGIAKEQLPYIFDRFYSLEKQTRKKEGTGIGLALSKNIMEAHHGQIQVESTEGKGTTFLLHLPLGGQHFSPAEKIQDFKDSEQIEAYRGNSLALPLADQSSDGHSHAQNTPQPAKVKPTSTLLIVEDNADIRTYLKEHLALNYIVKEAADGLAGWEEAQRNPPDLILADIAMPIMDGIELCAKVKTSIHTSHIPVVLLTARTSLIYQLDGLETGADDYITKPFNMQVLSARIKNLITTRKELQQRFAQSFDLSPSGVVMNSLDEQLLSRIKLLIERHIDNADFTVEQMAEALHMSRMQLYRKIKALTDFSPQQLIRHFRLLRATQLLETGQYNVSEVTYMVGYNDLKSFRSQFKKVFGVSPSGYESKD